MFAWFSVHVRMVCSVGMVFSACLHGFDSSFVRMVCSVCMVLITVLAVAGLLFDLFAGFSCIVLSVYIACTVRGVCVYTARSY